MAKKNLNNKTAKKKEKITNKMANKTEQNER